jgi:hypothetical protein
MEQTWNDLLFAHWPIDPDRMRSLVPSMLELDTFNGQCWLAVTPFHMTGIRARFMPPFPGLSAFPELNLRTYVNYDGKPGVYFFSLDAGSRIAAWVARKTYHLPYFHARMSAADRDGRIHYHSIRDSGAELKAKFRPFTQPWPLQNAECEFSINSVAASAGISLPNLPPLLHFAKRLEVLIWPLKRA